MAGWLTRLPSRGSLTVSRRHGDGYCLEPGPGPGPGHRHVAQATAAPMTNISPGQGQLTRRSQCGRRLVQRQLGLSRSDSDGCHAAAPRFRLPNELGSEISQ